MAPQKWWSYPQLRSLHGSSNVSSHQNVWGYVRISLSYSCDVGAALHRRERTAYIKTQWNIYMPRCMHTNNHFQLDKDLVTTVTASLGAITHQCYVRSAKQTSHCTVVSAISRYHTVVRVLSACTDTSTTTKQTCLTDTLQWQNTSCACPVGTCSKFLIFFFLNTCRWAWETMNLHGWISSYWDSCQFKW